MPSQKQRKGHIVRNENIQRYVSVKVPVKSCKISNISKYEHWDFTPSWRLCNNNNFYLNVTEWLASPGGTKFLKPIEEMSKEELNVFFLTRFCTSARKKDGTLSFYKSSSNIYTRVPPLIVPSLATAVAQQTLISESSFTEANEANLWKT